MNRLKNLQRQAFSEETSQNNAETTTHNNGGRSALKSETSADQAVVGQLGTGAPDNVAFWVPPNVATKASRKRQPFAATRAHMTFDCGDTSSLANSSNSSANGGGGLSPGAMNHHDASQHSPPAAIPEHSAFPSDPTSEQSGMWSSVTGQFTPASMDLFKRFTEKTVEVKNMIMGAEAIDKLTSAVSTAVNINHDSAQASPTAQPLMQQNSTGSAGALSSSFNGGHQFTNHNALDHNGASHNPGDPPPVVIPTLHKTGSSKKGHSMHQAIDFRKINTNLYDGEKKRMPTVQQANVDYEQSDDDVGTVKLVFEFQRANGIFVVTIDKVNGLPAPDDTSMMAWDPFCTLQLLPDKRLLTTKVARSTLNADFGEAFMFDVAEEDDLPNRILELTVAHRDQSATGQIIGWLRLAMNSFDFNARPGPTEVYRPLSHPDKKEGSKALGGNLLLSISYLATAKRLTIYVHEAKGMKFMDSHNDSNIDPSVRVSLVIDGKRTKKKKTASQHGANVVWNEAVTFTDITQDILTQNRLQAIEIEVAHEALLGDKPLGHLVISAASNVQSAKDHWVALKQGDDTPRWHRLRFTN